MESKELIIQDSIFVSQKMDTMKDPWGYEGITLINMCCIIALGDAVGIADEVHKTYEMLKAAGFNIKDISFEGIMSLQNKTTLIKLDELSQEKKALGVIKVVYEADKDQKRMIEIPVGSTLPEMNEEQ